MFFLYGLLVVFLLSVVFGVGALFGHTILQPLIQASRRRKAKFRFYTADFFSLSFVLALPAIHLSYLRNSSITPNGVVMVVGAITYTVAIWMWVRGATKLSVVGVSNSWKRFVFLAILLPAAVLGSAIAVPVVLVGLFASVADPDQRRIAMLMIVGIVAAVIAVAGKKTCAWVVRPDADSQEETRGEHIDDLFSTANNELKDSSLPSDD